MSKRSSDSETAGKRLIPMQFRLIHVSYAIAMLGATLAAYGSLLATFSPLAILLGVGMVAFWAYVSRRSRPRGLIEACLPALFLIQFCLIGPVFQGAHEAGRRAQCANNLKRIALALQNYHVAYGEFPPAYVMDSNGKPMHSWRVLILPFLDEAGLYGKYRFNEPWDGPNNRQLLDKIGWGIYQCPSDRRRTSSKRSLTSYVAVIGPRSVWPGSRSRKMSELSDGVSNTVIVVEYQGGQIAWTEPRDLQFDEALASFTSPDAHAAGLHHSEDFFFTYYFGRTLAYADGSCRFERHGLNHDFWSAVLTVDDGADPYQLEVESVWSAGMP